MGYKRFVLLIDNVYRDTTHMVLVCVVSVAVATMMLTTTKVGQYDCKVGLTACLRRCMFVVRHLARILHGRHVSRLGFARERTWVPDRSLDETSTSHDCHWKVQWVPMYSTPNHC